MVSYRLLHGRRIKATVRLRPRAPNCRALSAIKHTELDPCAICNPAHQAVQGVNLPDQMSLSQAANSRITGHCPERIEAMGNQRRVRSHASSRTGSLATGVAAPYHYDIVSHGSAGICFKREPLSKLDVAVKTR